MKARKCPERKSTMADLNDKLNELTNTEDRTSSYSPEDINNNKAMAILAYLSWLVLIPLFAAKESPFARFHVNQGLCLAIVEIICWVVFGILSKIGVRVNLMQNSALSFSICVDNNPQLIGRLIEELKSMFRVRYNENLQLVTIRYYTQQVIDRIVAGRPILLEQRSRLTEQIVVPLDK